MGRRAKLGRRADEFDFAVLCETVEFRLRNQHGAAGTKDERSAGARELLRRGLRIELVSEKCEMEIVGLAIVENDETIVGV